MSGLLSIMNTTNEEYDKMSSTIKNSTGALDEMSTKMKDNVKMDFTILKSSVEGLGLAFGETLAPKVRDFLQTATGMVNSFAGMSDWSKNLLIDITGLGLGFGATLLVVGKFISAIGAIKFGLAADSINGLSKGLETLAFNFKGLASNLGISVGALSAWTLGIGAVVIAIGSWIYWMATADERLAEFNSKTTQAIVDSQEKVKQSQDNVKTAKESLKEIQQLENEIAKTSNTEDRTAKEQALLDKKKELLNLFPELKNGFGDEASAIDGVVGSTEALIKKQEELIAMEKRKQAIAAREYFSKDENKQPGENIENYDNAQQAIANYDKQLKDLEGLSDDMIVKRVINGKTIAKSVGQIREEINKGMSDNLEVIDKENATLDQQLQNYKALEESGTMLTDSEKKRYEELKKWQEESANKKYEPQDWKQGVSFEVTSDPKKIEELAKQTRDMLNDMQSMDSGVKTAIQNMVTSMENGIISTSDFENALNLFTTTSTMNFGSLQGNITLAMDNMIQDLSSGKISFEEFGNASNVMSMYTQESMSKLSDTSQRSMEIMLSSLNSGQIKAGEFQGVVSAYMGYAENDFIGLNQASQQAINSIVQKFSDGEMSASEYQSAMGMMTAFVDSNFQKLPPSAQSAISQLKTQFNNGQINANQFASGVGQALGLTESDLASLAGASASDIGSLISDLISGKVNANNLQSAIQAIKSKEVTVTTVFKEVGKRPQSIPVGGGLTVDEWSLTPPSESMERPPAPTIDTYSIQSQSTTNATPMSSSSEAPSVSTMDSGTGSSASSDTPIASTFATSPSYSFSDIGYDMYAGMTDDEKKAAQDRVQLEEDAKKQILSLRNDLYKALKTKIEKQKEDELKAYDNKLDEIKKKYEQQKEYEESIYDARINVIKKEMELLDKSVNPSKEDDLKVEQDTLKEYQDNLAKLEAEKEKWLKNDSAMGKEQAKKLSDQIAEQNKQIEEQQKAVAKAEVEVKKEKLQESIDLLEQEKEESLNNLEEQKDSTVEAVENEKQAMLDKYEQMLSDKEIYLEANKMLQQGNMDEMLKLIEQYYPDWSDQGLIFGKSLADGIKEGIEQGLDGYKYLKDLSNGVINGTTPSTPNTSTPAPTPTPPKEEDKPKKGKVTASGLNVRSGAGTNNKILDSVYRDDEVEILESKDGWYYIDYYSKWRKKRDKGWASGNYIQTTFHTGGVIGDMDASSGIAIVKSKERVLTESQNKMFEGLVYDWIPKLESMFKNLSMNNDSYATTNGLTYNSVYNIQNKCDFDERNMEDNIIYNLKKQMKNMGKKF